MKMKEKKNKYNAYIKFSGIAIQMGVIICAGVFGGQWLDKKLEMQTPWFTIALSLLSVAIGLYLVIREVIKMNEE